MDSTHDNGEKLKAHFTLSEDTRHKFVRARRLCEQIHQSGIVDDDNENKYLPIYAGREGCFHTGICILVSVDDRSKRGTTPSTRKMHR